MVDSPTVWRDALNMLSSKGTGVAIALTVTAATLSVATKGSLEAFEKLLELLFESRQRAKLNLDSRAASMLLRLGDRQPTPAAQRILRQRQRHAARRLEETRALWKRQKRAASWASFINGLLIAAQYLVGAILATSFVQKTLSPNLIGTLGIVVVVASTVQQKYTPDIIASTAKTRVAKLRRTIIRSENDLVEANREGDGKDFQKVSDLLSKTIIAIEASLTETSYGTRNQPTELAIIEGDSDSNDTD